MKYTNLVLAPPMAISALHNEGIEQLRMALYCQLSQGDDSPITPVNKIDLKLAFAGRPNVGKSSLINSLMGHDHLLAGPETGITRDAVTLTWAWQDRMTSLTDTARLAPPRPHP